MDIAEIDALEVGEDLDTAIARHLMKWDENALKNNNIPTPQYSSDRRWSAAAVYALRNFPEGVIARFDLEIKSQIKAMKTMVNDFDSMFYLVFTTPDIICKAALKAIHSTT